MGRKRRSDQASVRSELVPVRFTADEREALKVLALRCETSESTLSRDIICRELVRSGVLRTPRPEAPPDVTDLPAESPPTTWKLPTAAELKATKRAALNERIEALQQRHRAVIAKRAALAPEIIAGAKRELAAVEEEIRSGGYDPTKLDEEQARAAALLEAMIAASESQLSKCEHSLDAFEASLKTT